MGLKIYYAGMYPTSKDTVTHSIEVINEWQENFTPDSRMQPELIKLYRMSPAAFYLYADVDWCWYDFSVYKIQVAPYCKAGLMGEKDVDYAKSKLDKLIFELVNLPLDHSIKNKQDLIPKPFHVSFYGNRDLGAMIDRDEGEFSKKWAWQQEWYRQYCQRENELLWLSDYTIESLWLEFARKYGLISHKSLRRADWVY